VGSRIALSCLSLICTVFAATRTQASEQAGLNQTEHEAEVERLAAESRARKAEAVEWARVRNMAIRFEDSRHTGELMALLDGRPLYYVTTNVEAATSLATDQIRDALPWDLDGSGLTVGIWDGAGVRDDHQEFQREDGSSRVTVREDSYTSGHATHVAGTIGAAGVDPLARGMAPAVTIDSYNWEDDAAQMYGRAATKPGEPRKIYVSNHSYGFVAGWHDIADDDFSGNRGWHWFGNAWAGASSREDWFGSYTDVARQWDEVAALHPYYLAFAAAGNDRTDNPEPGETVYYWQGAWKSIVYDPGTCPPGDGVFAAGYRTISGHGVAANIMTVGAVDEAVAQGTRGLAEATMAPFSCWGPTSDGRIKPDIVANGVGVYSTDNGSDHDYDTAEGTSMACPSAAGSAILLVQLYDRLFPGQAMRASTLKGLIIHTADDLGRPGPDYQYGWGMMNTRAAAELIQRHHDAPSGRHLVEGVVDTDNPLATFGFYRDGREPIRVTLCWTKPRLERTGSLVRLIHDLDLRLIGPDGSTTYYPYVLDRTDPTAPAYTGDNDRDNVEQIYLGTPPGPGRYTVQIEFAHSQGNVEQHYSLISSAALATEDQDTDSAVTREFRVSASEDDACGRPLAAWPDLFGDALTLGGGHSGIAVRFADVNVPRGCRILSAYLKFTRAGGAYNADDVYIDAVIHGEAAPNPGSFTGSRARFHDLQRTETSVEWDWEVGPSAPSGASGTSPDIAGIIQEIVDQPGWQPGNAMAILYMCELGKDTNVAYKSFNSFDYDPALAPRLVITYTQASDAEPPAVIAGPPTARDAVIAASRDEPVAIALVADDDGLPDPPGALTYTIASLPSHGALHDRNGAHISQPASLADGDNHVTYVPAEGFTSQDQFTFYADDGGTLPAGGVSNTATITISVRSDGGLTVTREFHVLQPEDNASGLGADSTTLSFGPDGSGMRFRNVDIPNGSAVIGARLRLSMSGTQINGPVEGVIRAEATGNAKDFTAENPPLDERSGTDASVLWPWELGQIDQDSWHSSPDIASVLQEVVDREDWWTGYSLVILCSGNDADLQFHGCAYDYADLAPKLQITYIPNLDPNMEPPVPEEGPPTAQDVEIEAAFNTPVTVTLEASDDGFPDPPGALTYTIATQPSHGTLEHVGGDPIDGAPASIGNINQIVYRPGAGFVGQDSFTYYADDGGTAPTGGVSNIATVTITTTDTPPPSPMAHWRLDEGEGTAAYDSVGDRQGRVRSPDWTDGKVNGALAFDGTWTYVVLPDNEPVWLPQNDFTIAFWAYFEARDASSGDELEMLFDFNYAASYNIYNEVGYCLYRVFDTGQIVFGMITSEKSEEDLFTDTQFEDGRWYHIVAVRNGTSQELYVDGELDADRTCSGYPIAFTGDYDDDKVSISRYTIRNLSGSHFQFKGKLDDIMLFDQALSPADVRRLRDGATSRLIGPPTAEDIQVATAFDAPVTIRLRAADDGLPDPPG
jgi:hypothetical protein